MDDRPPVVQCEHLVRHYDTATGRVQAVRGVDLEVRAGSLVAVAGPSGCGKSSLLRMVAGLDRPTAGLLLLDGVDLWSLRPGPRARRRADVVRLVRQRPGDNLLPHLSAIAQLQRSARARQDVAAIASGALERLGLDQLRDATPTTMSGGERQRLAVGCGLVAGQPVLVADEPTSQLDGPSALAVVDALHAAADAGAAVLVASHDRRLLDHVPTVVQMRDGAITSVTDGDEELAVIDRSGRVQLPPPARDRFPGNRARLRLDGDDVVLEQP